MADQEASIVSADNVDNQISVGLAASPNANIFSYLLDTLKVTSAAFCTNEQNPDYLPLVGVRTRRLGEVYPYPDLQGYRSGNEVTVVAYMQGVDKDIPPPARVISYMKPNPVALSYVHSLPLYTENAIIGISAGGTIGLNAVSQYDGGGLSKTTMSYKGFELMNTGNNRPALGSLSAFSGCESRLPDSGYRVASHSYYDSWLQGAAVDRHTVIDNGDHIEQLLPSQFGAPVGGGVTGSLAHNTKPLLSDINEVKRYTSVGDDTVRVDIELTNISASDYEDFFYSSGFSVDMGDVYSHNVPNLMLNTDAFHVSVSEDFSYARSINSKVAVGIVCKSNVEHNVRQDESLAGSAFVSAIYGISQPGVLSYTNPIKRPGFNGVIVNPSDQKFPSCTVNFYVPFFGQSSAITLTFYIIFADDANALVLKANAILAS